MHTRLGAYLEQHGADRSVPGIYSVCSAHPWVVQAAVLEARERRTPVLLEATSNQVNPEGGYTGMRPADFRRLVHGLSEAADLPAHQVLLGGDHLGPNPWQHRGAAEAMAAAKVMIAQYAAAGFHKLHLDTSMPCADDISPLREDLIAEHAADLCEVAEQASTGARPVYIIGTEVPVPAEPPKASRRSRSPRAAPPRRPCAHREIFHARSLHSAWLRVVGLVVQPGVEFNHETVVDYVPEKVHDLCHLLHQADGLVFEAHSTDYQRPGAYKHLVSDGFSTLKVGPALTFAVREAIFASPLSRPSSSPPRFARHFPASWRTPCSATPRNGRHINTARPSSSACSAAPA